MPTTKLTTADEFGELPPGFTREGNYVRNPDGTLRTHIDASDLDPADDETVCLTGAVSGLIPMADGTVYDVTAPAIVVRDVHKAELHRAILHEHHKQGRFLDVPAG